MQAGFAVIFSAVFGLLWFYSQLNCQKPFRFFRARKSIVCTCNRSEGFDNFFLKKGPCLLSYHIRETEFSFLAELDIGERHFEPIARWKGSKCLSPTSSSAKTAEEAKKNAAIAAVQALKMETSTKDPPRPLRPVRPGTFVVGLNSMNVKMNSS